MKVTLFLFQPEVSSFDRLLKPRSLQGRYPYRAVPDSPFLTFPHRLYLQINARTEPAWIAAHFGKYFDVSAWGAINQHTSGVLLFTASGRTFAAVYGRGFQALCPESLEDDFGLRSSLSAVDIDRVTRLSARTIERVSRNRCTSFGAAKPLIGCGLEAGMESLSDIHGAVRDPNWARSIGGKVSLSLSGSFDLNDLQWVCSLMLQHFENESIQEKFSWLLAHQPLTRRQAEAEKLPERLVQAFQQRASDVIALSVPEPENWNPAITYRIQCGRNKVMIEDLDLDTLYRFFDEKGIPAERWPKALIEAFDEDGKVALPRMPVTDYLSGEWQENNRALVHLNGRWYRLNPQYLAVCREIIKHVEDVSSRWALPPRLPEEHEGGYNSRVALEKGWLKFDCKNFSLGGHQRVEICDLLNGEGDFICNKQMSSSKAMSHLFAQGSNSAALFRHSPEYAAIVRTSFHKCWPDAAFPATPRIVFAIPNAKKGPLWKTLFGFSAIQLVGHINRIRSHGFDVALCSIKDQKFAKRAASARTRTGRAA